MNRHEKILAILAEGPDTCAGISAELHVGKPTVAATLQQMHAAGKIARTPEPVLLYGHIQPMHIYRLPEHANA